MKRTPRYLWLWFLLIGVASVVAQVGVESLTKFKEWRYPLSSSDSRVFWMRENSVNGDGRWAELPSTYPQFVVTNLQAQLLNVSNLFVTNIFVQNSADFSNVVIRGVEGNWIWSNSAEDLLTLKNTGYAAVYGFGHDSPTGFSVSNANAYFEGGVSNGASLVVVGSQTNLNSFYGGDILAGSTVGGSFYDLQFTGDKFLTSDPSGEILEGLGFDFTSPSAGQVIAFHSATLLTNVAAGGGSGPTTNAPPQTLAINSGQGTTNILLDFLALGATNHVRATLTANAGLIVTNVVDGKAITMELIQDSTGNRGFTTNLAWGFNVRFGIDVTGFALSTNASTKDIIRFIGSGTNALVAGNLRGFSL